jgi:deoxyribodipyrimidine photo-lyase
MIHPSRVRDLNDKPVRKGAYVLYWMQQSQRTRWNHALEFAVRQANALGLPPVVAFGITDDYPEANERHYAFMLDGLRDVADALRRRGILFVLRLGQPPAVALELAANATLVVADRGYLRIQRSWRELVAREAPCRVHQVESDVVVPVNSASAKEEYSAATLRPKIHRLLHDHLQPLLEQPVAHSSLGLRLRGLDAGRPAQILKKLRIGRSVGTVTAFRGGEREAAALLHRFVAEKLDAYATDRNKPALNAVSSMSPYLHFGQVSPLELALAVRQGGPSAGADAFVEELVVRRELAINFVQFCPHYDEFACLPAWALRTLAKHAADERPHLYSPAQLEEAATHDPYWNAAQAEMLRTGKMHNYMRMYWGKKIIEWTAAPEEAFHVALRLNNKYELDGRDANSYAGVAWCFGKHDRPWGERAVFGQVRYMNDAGLRRKFDMDGYLRRVGDLD